MLGAPRRSAVHELLRRRRPSNSLGGMASRKGSKFLTGPWAWVWVSLAVLAAVIASFAIYICFEFGWLPQRPFDSVAWKRVERADDETRLQMVDSLLRSGRLDGLSRPQVLALLGPAHGFGYFREYDLVYWLGPERGPFRIDSEWLLIRLGPDGRVLEYRLARD